MSIRANRLAVLLVLMIVLSGCAPAAAPQAVPQSATMVPTVAATPTPEPIVTNKLRLYSTNEETEHAAMQAAFEKASGITMSTLRFSGGEGWVRVEAEAESGNIQADAQWGMLHSLAQKAKGMDILECYVSPAWEDIPQMYWDPEGCWYGWSYWFINGVYNTEVLAQKGLEPPKSWKDLLDPKWKGEIVMPNPGTAGTAFVIVATIMQLYGEEEGWKYLEELDKNVDQYTKSGSAPAQLVAQGEYAFGLTWDQAVTSRKAEGFPVEMWIPEEGVGYDLDVAVIFKTGQNLTEAKKLIDWLGTTEAQQLAGTYRSRVTRPGVPALIDTDPKLVEYDVQWVADNRDRIMEDWKTKFQK